MLTETIEQRLNRYTQDAIDGGRQSTFALFVAIASVAVFAITWYYFDRPDLAVGLGSFGVLISIALAINAGVAVVSANQCLAIEKQGGIMDRQDRLLAELKGLREALAR